MDIKLRTSFPEGFEPNEAQEVIIDGIEKALSEDKRFIIINAPTGSGKSFVSKMIANYSSLPSDSFVEFMGETCRWGKYDFGDKYRFGTAVLTCTKSLQDQYADQFKDGAVLKGQINYECPKEAGVLCDSASCKINDRQKDKCWNCRECPYLNARHDAAVNRCSFYNYSMFLSLPNCVKYKDFIVCDEASELEDTIVSEFTQSFDLILLATALPRVPALPDEGSDDIAYLKWVQETNKACRNRMAEMTTDKDGNKKKIGPKLMQKYVILDETQRNLQKMETHWNDTEWFKIHEETGIKFMPYQIDKLAGHFFKFAKHVILMSATIVNVKKFAKTLGINDFAYIDAPSSFDPGRAYIMGWRKQFRPNFKNKNSVIPEMSEVVKNICMNEKYANKKGIIHTNSFDILYMLKKVVGGSNKRYLFRQAGSSNEEILDIHKETERPTILVSPSMTHGVDLKGELGEFQIIMKAPYPNLGDPRTKRKFNEDKEWYQDKMLSTLIQACGRCNRTKEDVSITFVLDFNAYEALVVNSYKLPKYFQQRMSKDSGQRYQQLLLEQV